MAPRPVGLKQYLRRIVLVSHYTAKMPAERTTEYASRVMRQYYQYLLPLAGVFP